MKNILRDYILQKKHRALRTVPDYNFAEEYSRMGLDYDERVARHFETVCEMERAVLLPGEKICFMRTVNTPSLVINEAEKKAASIRYRITSVGIPFSQSKIPASERVSLPTAHELVWALLSPERSVLDAIRLKDAAVYGNTSDGGINTSLAYFAFLAKYGYLEEVK